MSNAKAKGYSAVIEGFCEGLRKNSVDQPDTPKFQDGVTRHHLTEAAEAAGALFGMGCLLSAMQAWQGDLESDEATADLTGNFVQGAVASAVKFTAHALTGHIESLLSRAGSDNESESQ